eukprot:7828368-Ditylum_brightwellii.AAC.1
MVTFSQQHPAFLLQHLQHQSKPSCPYNYLLVDIGLLAVDQVDDIRPLTLVGIFMGVQSKQVMTAQQINK